MRNLKLIATTLWVLVALLLMHPFTVNSQVAKIVEQIQRGEKVVLHKDSIYDFTPYEMITVSDSIIGNGARIIHNRLFLGAASQNLTAVFKANSGAYFSGIRFQGANGHVGNMVNDRAQCMIITYSDAIIEDCSFNKCDKWAVNVYGTGFNLDTVRITRCNFENTKMGGYGYGIWVKNAILYVKSCTFHNNRHALDGSNKFSQVFIDSCTFYNHYIPVHQHEYSEGIYGFNIFSVRNSVFYSIYENVKLKLPYTRDSGYTEVVNCKFMTDSIKTGTIANQPLTTFQHPQWKFEGNKFVGEWIPPTIGINMASPDSLPIGSRQRYVGLGNYKEYTWSNGALGKQANKVLDRPDVFIMKAYGKGTPYAYARTIAYEDSHYFSFWLQINGFGTAYVYRNDSLIYTIPYSKSATWKQWVFRGPGVYRVSLTGSPTFPTVYYIDDVSWTGGWETFELRTFKVKFKYNNNGGTTAIKLGVATYEFRTGQQSLQVTLPANHPGRLDMMIK